MVRTPPVFRDDAPVSVARWRDPRAIAEAHAWLRETADRAGRRIVGAIDQPHVRPWATVFRAQTDRGEVYLKLCGPSQAFEPALTALLAGTAAGLVPEVLAIHPREPWMLLAGGGEKLRDVLGGPALLDAWAALVPRYAELQRAFLGRDDAVLACGTPDHRLERVVGDLRVAAENERVLAATSGTFGPHDRERLRALLPHLEARCAELGSAGIGPTIQHDDLHDANALSNGARTVIFDWGDACLTHPFLSLGVLLKAAAHRAGLDADDAAILRLRDAYLEPWTDLLPGRALEELADLGARLSTLTRALSWYRVATLDEGALDGEPGMMGEYLGNILGGFGPDGRTRWV
jgi:hypothetical protein